MPSTQNIRFQYYVPYITDASGKTQFFDFTGWVEKIDAIKDKHRVKVVFNISTRLETLNYLHNEKVWGMRFLKMRDFNIPMIAKEKGSAENISLENDEYVAEGLHVIYDDQHNFLMIQINKQSLSLSALTNYINQIWDNTDENLSLKPIMRDIDLRKFRKKTYKKLRVGFANLTPENTAHSDAKFFGGIINGFHRMHCRSAEITVSLGHIRNDTLSLDTVNEAIEDVADNKEIITSAIVCCDGDTDASEVINLLDCVVEDYISFRVESRSSLAFETVIYNMAEKYNGRQNTLLAIMQRN